MSRNCIHCSRNIFLISLTLLISCSIVPQNIDAKVDDGLGLSVRTSQHQLASGDELGILNSFHDDSQVGSKLIAKADHEHPSHADTPSSLTSDVHEELCDESMQGSEALLEHDGATRKDKLLAKDAQQENGQTDILCTVYYGGKNSGLTDSYTSFTDAINNINKGERLDGQSIEQEDEILVVLHEPITLDKGLIIKRPLIIDGGDNRYSISKSSANKGVLFEITGDDHLEESLGAVRFRHVTLEGRTNPSHKQSLIKLSKGPQLVLEDCNLKNNQAHNGGAIYVGQDGRLSLEVNCQIKNCSADFGGAIFADKHSQVNLSKTQISHCIAYENAAALYFNPDSQATLKSVSLENNELKAERDLFLKGRVIYGNGAKIDIDGSQDDPSTISNTNLDSAERKFNSSAVYLKDCPKVAFKNCNISKFKAKNGGAIQVNTTEGKSSKVELIDSKISDCEASYGGALYLGYEVEGPNLKDITLTLSGDTEITNCIAKSGGAVLVRNNATFTMRDNTKISHCEAHSNSGDQEGVGGGIDLRQGVVNLLNNASIQNCTALSKGDITGFEAMGGAINLSRKNPLENVQSPYASLHMRDNAKIVNCKAAYGGAIAQQDNSQVTLKGAAEISQCSALRNGGVVCGMGGEFVMDADEKGYEPHLKDNLAQGSSTGQGGMGGAIYCGGITGQAYNVTLNAGEISNNSSASHGGGLCIYGYGSNGEQNRVSLGHNIRIIDNKVGDKANNLEVMKRGGPDYPTPRLILVKPEAEDRLKVGITGYNYESNSFCSNAWGGSFAKINNDVDDVYKEYKPEWKDYIQNDVNPNLTPYISNFYSMNEWKWGAASDIVVKNKVVDSLFEDAKEFNYQLTLDSDCLITNEATLPDTVGIEGKQVKFKLDNNEEVRLGLYNYSPGPSFTISQNKVDDFETTYVLDQGEETKGYDCRVKVGEDRSCENHSILFTNTSTKAIPLTAVDEGAQQAPQILVSIGLVVLLGEALRFAYKRF